MNVAFNSNTTDSIWIPIEEQVSFNVTIILIVNYEELNQYTGTNNERSKEKKNPNSKSIYLHR